MNYLKFSVLYNHFRWIQFNVYFIKIIHVKLISDIDNKFNEGLKI